MRRWSYFSVPEPRLFGHRGASALAPENTIEAFRRALEATPYIELDVRLTADAHVVVIHDASIIRTTGRRGRVEKMTLEALQVLDAGFGFTLDHGHSFPFRGRGIRVPTLEEVLRSFPEALLNVEIKRTREDAAEAVAETLLRLDAAGRVLVASFEHDVLRRFRVAAPEVPTNFSRTEVRHFLARVREQSFDGYAPPGAALQVPEFFGLRRVVSPPFIEAAHRLGVEVHVWGVKDVLDIRRFLALGVDGVMVDDPAAVAGVVDEYGASPTVSLRGGEGVF